MTSYGGAIDRAQVAGDLGVEAEGAERADLGHGFLERRGSAGRKAQGARERGLGRMHRTIGAVGRPLSGAVEPSTRGARVQLFRLPARRCSDHHPPQSRSPRAPSEPPVTPARCASPRAILVLLSLLPAVAGARRRGRGRPDDDRPRAAPGPRPGRAPGSPIAVDLENAGPTVTGELRIAGGADSRTRFGDAGRARDRVAQAVPPVRAAALVRRQHEGPARRTATRSSGRGARRRSPSTTSSSSSWAWSPRTRPRSSASSTCCRTRTASRR